MARLSSQPTHRHLLDLSDRFLPVSHQKQSDSQAFAAAKAAKAGGSERTVRRVETDVHSRATKGLRHWRTHKDPFAEVWEKKENWRATYGPDKEVMFRHVQEPGRLGLSDFTEILDFSVTIASEELTQRLYHFHLTYSGWSYVSVVLGGESYEALAEGLQEALWRLGGVPLEHRMDSLSAAYKNLTKEAQEDLTLFLHRYRLQTRTPGALAGQRSADGDAHSCYRSPGPRHTGKPDVHSG